MKEIDFHYAMKLRFAAHFFDTIPGCRIRTVTVFCAAPNNKKPLFWFQCNLDGVDEVHITDRWHNEIVEHCPAMMTVPAVLLDATRKLMLHNPPLHVAELNREIIEFANYLVENLSEMED